MEQSRAVGRTGSGIVPIDLKRTAGAGDDLHFGLQRRFAQKGEALFRHFANFQQVLSGKGIAGHEFQQGQQTGIDQRQSRHVFAAFFGLVAGFLAAGFFAAGLAFPLAGLWATG